MVHNINYRWVNTHSNYLFGHIRCDVWLGIIAFQKKKEEKQATLSIYYLYANNSIKYNFIVWLVGTISSFSERKFWQEVTYLTVHLGTVSRSLYLCHSERVSRSAGKPQTFFTYLFLISCPQPRHFIFKQYTDKLESWDYSNTLPSVLINRSDCITSQSVCFTRGCNQQWSVE